MIVLTLYYGFTSGGVDNMAHIGGLLAGFYQEFFSIGSVRINTVPAYRADLSVIVP